MTCWWQALFEGDVAKVQIFIRYNIDMYLTHEHRRSALHYVCWGGSTTGHLRILRILLERGADIHALDEFENTPLHLAAYCGYKTMCRKLLESGASLKRFNLNSRRPIDTALHWKRFEVYRLLASWNAAKHWRDLTRRRKKYKERRTLLKIWYRKGLSCEFKNLACWI